MPYIKGNPSLQIKSETLVFLTKIYLKFESILQNHVSLKTDALFKATEKNIVSQLLRLGGARGGKESFLDLIQMYLIRGVFSISRHR